MTGRTPVRDRIRDWFTVSAVATALVAASGCHLPRRPSSGTLDDLPPVERRAESPAPNVDPAPSVQQAFYQATVAEPAPEPELPATRGEDRRKQPAGSLPVANEPLAFAAELTVEQLESMALAGNPAIAEAAARVDALQGRWVQVGLPPNPIAGYSGQQLGSRGLAEQQGVLFQQELVTARKLRWNREIACFEIQQASQQLAAMQQRVQTDVRLEFVEALISQRQIELSRELLGIATKAAETTRQLVEAGEATKAGLLQLQVEAESTHLLLTTAENRHRAAWRRLAAIVGRPGLPPHRLVGELSAGPTLDWDETVTRLKSGSPLIAAAAANVERARAKLVRARREAIPNVTVQGIVQDDQATGSSNGAIQATLPVPIWNRNQGAIREAYSELVEAERALDRLQLQLEWRLAATLERYANARTRVERFEAEILPKSRETLEIITAAFQEGEIDALTVLTAQRTFSQANVAHLESLRESRAAGAEIDGLLLKDSLDSAF